MEAKTTVGATPDTTKQAIERLAAVLIHLSPGACEHGHVPTSRATLDRIARIWSSDPEGGGRATREGAEAAARALVRELGLVAVGGALFDAVDEADEAWRAHYDGVAEVVDAKRAEELRAIQPSGYVAIGTDDCASVDVECAMTRVALADAVLAARRASPEQRQREIRTSEPKRLLSEATFSTRLRELAVRLHGEDRIRVEEAAATINDYVERLNAILHCANTAPVSDEVRARIVGAALNGAKHGA